MYVISAMYETLLVCAQYGVSAEKMKAYSGGFRIWWKGEGAFS